MDLDTAVENTWCPGCGNFGILGAAKQAFEGLVEDGYVDAENLVISSGIGCHAKVFDYLEINGFYSIHGRVPPTITGVKVANPDLVAVGFTGDGDAYDEGISHLVHAAKRNVDVTMVVHDNSVFALTTGQFTATSPRGFEGKSTPGGSVEEPLNPLRLLLASRASFVARGFSGDVDGLRSMIVEAVTHEGFSIIDVLQPCVTFYDTWGTYRDAVEGIGPGHDTRDFDAAWELTGETERLPTGVLYREERPTFEELVESGGEAAVGEVADGLV